LVPSYSFVVRCDRLSIVQSAVIVEVVGGDGGARLDYNTQFALAGRHSALPFILDNRFYQELSLRSRTPPTVVTVFSRRDAGLRALLPEPQGRTGAGAAGGGRTICSRRIMTSRVRTGLDHTVSCLRVGRRPVRTRNGGSSVSANRDGPRKRSGSLWNPIILSFRYFLLIASMP
jgi:hypothetical protein